MTNKPEPVSSLIDHPRLYLGREAQQRLKGPFRHAALRASARAVARLADEYVQSPAFDWERNTHNAHLIRARRMQGRIVTLLARWTQTGETRYRAAALEHLREMGRWEYWSWIAWRDHNPAPDAIFDLSYGENCATLAIGYDWLYDTLDAVEQRDLLAVAERPVTAFLKHTEPESRAWWFGRPDSNWNTVCAGGAGMLALAFDPDLPAAADMLARAQASIAPFVAEIHAAHGGWSEGIGYWNYGMRYLYLFVLSLEQATGKRSAWLKGPAIGDSLDFPMRFTPHPECDCSFGDVNHWAPLPFHFAMARRLKRTQTLAELNRHLNAKRIANEGGGWPNAAELLCLHGDETVTRPKTVAPFLHPYKGLDWVALADRMPAPRLYAAVRGGTTEVPHGHIDLTSFHAVVGDERLLVNLGPSGYLDTTFSARRWDLIEMIPMSKNVLLIDGAGISRPASVATRAFKSPWGPAVRIDATEAIGTGRRGNDGVIRYHRLFVLIPGTGLLVVDAVKRPHPSLFEQRFCTLAHTDIQDGGFRLKGLRQTASLRCACSAPADLYTAEVPLTRPTPDRPPTLMRQITQRLHEEIVLATLLVPGSRPTPLSIQTDPRAGVSITIGAKRGRVLRFKSMGAGLTFDGR